MGKHDEPQSFGENLEEVEGNIADMNKRREELSKKVGTKDFSKKDNKEFELLTNNLETANRQRSTFLPIQGQAEPFVEQRTEVFSDPNLLPQEVGTALGLTPTTGIGLEQQPTQQVGIGEIQIPQSGSQQIIQSTLEGITRGTTPSVGQEIDKSIFGGEPPPPIQQPGAPLIQEGADISFGAADPILKGTVGGQIIGQQPIFVGGGGFLAIHNLNNRKKAIQDQANLRAEETNALLLQKPPIVKDQRFQGSLNQQFNATKEKFIAEAKRIYGADWDIALKDQTNPLGRAFVQDLANFDFIAGQTDQVTDLIAEIDKDLESGDQVFSDETLQLRDDYNQLQNDFLSGNISGVVNLADRFNKLKGFTNLDKIIDDQSIDIKGQVTQIAFITDKDDRFETTTKKITQYEDQLRIIAKGLAGNQMRDAVRQGFITEDEIFNRINARYGYESITTKKVTLKRKGAAVKIVIDPNQNFGNPGKEKILGTEVDRLATIEIPTGFKPVSATGLIEYDANGNTSTVDGVRDVDFNSFKVLSYIDAQGNEQRRAVIVGTHEEEEFGVITTKTVAYDLPSERGRIITEGFMNPDDFDRMMDGYNEIIRGAPQKSTESTIEGTSEIDDVLETLRKK